MPVRIAVIAEAEADCRIVCDLIDRKIRHHAPDWFDAGNLDDCREWCGLEPGMPFTRWNALKELNKEEYRQALRRPGPLGFSGPAGFSKPAAPKYDGAAARKAIVLATLVKPRPDVVMLVRDMDQQGAERRASIETERNQVDASAMKIVLALPDAKREAWVLNGFIEKDAKEKTALAALKAELGFHPCECAERLMTAPGSKKDAKRVLALLSEDDREREAACWQQTDWQTLRSRGRSTGLHSFLKEVYSRLLPSFYPLVNE